MKHRYVIILLSLGIVACSVPPKDKNDLEQNNLKGNVKSVRAIYLTDDEQDFNKRNIDFSSYQEFNEDGDLVQESSDHFYDGEYSSTSDTYFFYDENKLLLKKELDDYTYLYKYTSPIEFDIYNSQGKHISKETRNYDNSGCLVEMKSESNSDGTYNCNRHSYNYDKEHNLITESWYSSSNLNNNGEEKLNSTTNYKYDTNGVLLRQISESYNHGVKKIESVYEYDNTDRLISETINEEQPDNNKRTYFITYEYDNYNNWIKRSVYDSKNKYLDHFSPTHVIEREINYYGDKELNKTRISGVIEMLKEQKIINQHCNIDIAENLVLEYMGLNYPDWEIYSEIKATRISNCIFNIQYQVINPHFTTINQIEQIVAELSIVNDYTQYSFKIKRGTLY